MCLSAFSSVELLGLHLLLPAQPAGRGGAALPQQLLLPLVALLRPLGQSAEGAAPAQVSLGVLAAPPALSALS